jgi:hypothetical protein
MNLKYRIGQLLFKILKSLSFKKEGILSNYISYFLVLFIGSNHPRRIKNMHKIVNNIYLNEYEKIKNINFFFEKKKYKTINLFVGDSHSEFFGRNFYNSDNDKLYLTFHTGPTLLSEFGSSNRLIKKIYKIIKFLKLYFLKQYVNLNVIFCFGEIDVRTFFYQKIKIEKIYKNTNDYSHFLSLNFYKNFVNLKKKLMKKKITNINFYFNDIVFPSRKKYHLPKNIYQLRKKKAFIKFPNLGTLKNRITYRKNLIQNMKKKLISEKIKFLDLSRNCQKIVYLSKKNSIDGFHVTNFKLIKKIHQQIS